MQDKDGYTQGKVEEMAQELVEIRSWMDAHETTVESIRLQITELKSSIAFERGREHLTEAEVVEIRSERASNTKSESEDRRMFSEGVRSLAIALIILAINLTFVLAIAHGWI